MKALLALLALLVVTPALAAPAEITCPEGEALQDYAGGVRVCEKAPLPKPIKVVAPKPARRAQVDYSDLLEDEPTQERAEPGFWCGKERNDRGTGPFCSVLETRCKYQNAPEGQIIDTVSCVFRRNVVQLRAWNVVDEEWSTWFLPDFATCRIGRNTITRPGEVDWKRVSQCDLLRGKDYRDFFKPKK